jgi:hypothetical protein
MYLIRPIHILTDDNPEPDLQRVGRFLRAHRVEQCGPGPKLDDLYLVGPYQNEMVARLLERFGQTDVLNDRVKATIAYGIWMQPDVRSTAEAPVVQVFKQVAGMGDHPLLIADNRLRPGELIVVPEECDSFVALASHLGAPLLQFVKWFAWRGSRSAARVHRQHEQVEARVSGRTTAPTTQAVVQGRMVNCLHPWLSDSECLAAAPLDDNRPSSQLTPMLPLEEAECFTRALVAGPWARRTGDIYTQDFLELRPWCHSGDAPEIVQRVVQRLSSPELPSMVTRLTGVHVEALRELVACRLRAGERILPHADTSYAGELLIRANWLLSVPEETQRPWDFRFWNPDYPAVAPVVYPSRPNHATFFLLGKNTPHDVPPVPDGAGERVNVVLSFGKREPGTQANR